MPITIKILFLTFFIYFLSGMTAFTQDTDNFLVWPGDINNNGEVNHIDLLYLGVAYNHVGEERNQQNGNWGAFLIPDTLWEYDYFNGLNYCYADCNGDGVVNFFDQTVIEDNYGLSHGTIEDDLSPVGAIDGLDPEVHFGINTILVEEGQTVTIPIRLGTDANPVSAFHGAAFTLSYNSDYIVDGSLAFNFTGNWVGTSAFQPVLSIQKEKEFLDEIEIAITKTDGSSEQASGIIGSVSFVIIGDVPDVIEEPVLEIEGVFSVDEFLDVSPMLGDQLFIEILTNEEEVIAGVEEVNLYPNPASNGLFNIEIPQSLEIEGLGLYDVSGKEYKIESSKNDNIIEVIMGDIPLGVYILELETNVGVFHKKIFISEP